MYCSDMHTRFFFQIYNQNSDLLVQSNNYGIHCYLGYIGIYFNKVKQPVKIIYANDVSQRNYEYIHYWTVWFFNYI